jgi:uncharacterized repeat protein (TIGR04052 family)
MQSPAKRAAAILPLSLAAIIGFLVACSGQRETPVEIRFDLSKEATDIAAVRDLRFYLHDVELLTNDQAYAVKLVVTPWQSQRVALISLVDSVASHNSALQGIVASKGDYNGLRFTLGVPFDLNHANPLIASAPLNQPELFWSWNSGYKFMRVDLVDHVNQEREWSFHLGSTGCSSASALRPPQSPCAQPNLVRVELRGFDPTKQVVRLRLSELISAMHAANFAVCVGDYQHNAACAAAYSTTGLDVTTGKCADDVCKTQQLFGE